VPHLTGFAMGQSEALLHCAGEIDIATLLDSAFVLR
jgi:hypothetical protein